MTPGTPEFISLKRFLDENATRINSTDFIAADPVQFPRRFGDIRDIEIVSLLCATIAWGNRTMICRNCTRLLELMDNDPRHYVEDEAYESVPDDMNIHRTFFGTHFKQYLRGLHAIYRKFPSLDAFAAHHKIGESEAPAWKFAECMRAAIAEAAGTGQCDSRCLPGNLESTALKRINMALRWLVRDDGIVDLGVWKSITPAQLFIPLDVHVGNTARALNMISRNANDRRTVFELTQLLRQMRPEDPVVYDYALFGVGMETKKATH